MAKAPKKKKDETKTQEIATVSPAKKTRPSRAKNGGNGNRVFVVNEEFLHKVKSLALDNATYKDCAAALGMSHQNFGHLVRGNPKVAEAYDTGKAYHRISLSRSLSDMAIKQKNVAAAIFLAKQSEDQGGLGMSDRQEMTGKGGAPIQITFLPGDEKL